jgi:hypothetical protein
MRERRGSGARTGGVLHSINLGAEGAVLGRSNVRPGVHLSAAYIRAQSNGGDGLFLGYNIDHYFWRRPYSVLALGNGIMETVA